MITCIKDLFFVIQQETVKSEKNRNACNFDLFIPIPTPFPKALPIPYHFPINFYKTNIEVFVLAYIFHLYKSSYKGRDKNTYMYL